MEGSPIARSTRGPTQTIDETIKKYLNLNSLSINMVYDWTLWHRRIHVTEPTKSGTKFGCCLLLYLYYLRINRL